MGMVIYCNFVIVWGLVGEVDWWWGKSGPKSKAKLWVKDLIAATTGDGLRVAAGARVLLTAVWAFVQIANWTAFAAHMLAASTLLVEKLAQLFQSIACNSSFIGGNGIVSMMVMATRGTVDAVRQVDQFMRHSDFDRSGLHVRLDENEVPVVQRMRLRGILDTPGS